MEKTLIIRLRPVVIRSYMYEYIHTFQIDLMYLLLYPYSGGMIGKPAIDLGLGKEKENFFLI